VARKRVEELASEVSSPAEPALGLVCRCASVDGPSVGWYRASCSSFVLVPNDRPMRAHLVRAPREPT
jgi:hypothetical protein